MLIPAALLAAALAQRSVSDPFVAQHDAAAERNPLSVAFTVAFDGGRRAFRIGEPIPLVLTYDYVPNRSGLQGKWLGSFATAVLDHRDGTRMPSDDLLRAGIYSGEGICGCIEGGIPGAGKPPAVVLRVWLTSTVRFVEPGHYRLYISDHHDDEYYAPAERPSPIVSNVVELDIVRDRQWEEETLDAALRVLDTSADGEARQSAVSTILGLDSPRAFDESLRRLRDEGRFWSGIYDLPDRGRVLERVGALIDDPSYPATFDTIRTAAILRLTHDKPGTLLPGDKRAAMRAVETRRLRALDRAGMLVGALAESLREDSRKPIEPSPLIGPQPGTGPVIVSDALAGFVAATEAALARLSSADREHVLLRDADAFVAQPFAPMLERLARRGSGSALRLLNEVAPERARPLVVTDLARVRPRWPADVTALLPDSTLPALATALLRQLRGARTRAEAREALLRINRYAPVEIGHAVAGAYDARRWRGSCDVAVPAMSYFFRAEASRARAMASAMPCADEWDRSVDWRSTVVRMSPGLETFAGEQAAASDPDAAIWASRLLASHGTARAKELLLRALEAWRVRADVDVEKELMFGLVTGHAWQLTPLDIQRACAGRTNDECGDWLRPALPDDREPSLGVWVDPRTRRRFFSLGRGGLTEEQLLVRLSAFPAATIFHWSRDPDMALHHWDIDVDRDAPIAAGLARRQGMTFVVR